MRKEDFRTGMDATRIHGEPWDATRLPLGFRWRDLDEHQPVRGIGTLGRLDQGYYLYHYGTLLPEGALVVEIGTLNGASAVCMGMGMRGKDGKIVTIDPILHQPHRIGQVLDTIKHFKMEDAIFPKAGTSEEVLNGWDGREIDLLYIDGSHTAEDVLIDCRWMEHVRVDGVTVFDDWCEPVKEGAFRYLEGRPEWEELTASTAQPPGHPWLTVFWRNA